MAAQKKELIEKFVKYIRQNIRRILTAEQKILIVMEGLRAETSVADFAGTVILHSHSFMPGKRTLWK